VRKQCSKCGEITDNFGRSSSSSDGLRSQCKPCDSSYSAFRQYGGESKRAYNLMRKYGITLEEYDNMLEDQGGCCAICKSTDPLGSRFVVDHNHDTGDVRGLLCKNCNTGIGLLKDSPEVLVSAVDYLLERGNYAKDI